MKTKITLTKTLGLAALLFIFAGAFAANPNDDRDTAKCKKKCCKEKKAEQEMTAAMQELTETMQAFTLKAFTSVNTDVAHAIAVAPIKIIKNGNRIIIIQSAETPNKETETSKQKIDFNNLNKEMDKVQEDMSQIDPVLKSDDDKSRKAAEDILKTGVRS